jgi:hypothetical protein
MKFSALVAAIAGPSAILAAPWVKNNHNQWLKTNEWMVGSNFVPSTAVNELQMFQVDTFDSVTINRELGYAESLGFNSMRVFLHNLLWEDSETLLKTMDLFLSIAESHGIKIMFVLLDSCWNAYPALGPQPAPTPYVHNSQWVQAPGTEILHDSAQFVGLKDYVTGVVSHFQNDTRVIAWDLWNEPDNSGYTAELITPLLEQVFSWAREANPTQPLTTPLWKDRPWDGDNLNSLQKLQIESSDIISFHNYGDITDLQAAVESLGGYGKPLVCTEYMARGAGSFFDPSLGYLKEAQVSAFNWGLVSGLSQTIYAWSLPPLPLLSSSAIGTPQTSPTPMREWRIQTLGSTVPFLSSPPH